MPTKTNDLASRLSLIIVGNGLLIIASGASGVLVGLYLADLATLPFFQVSAQTKFLERVHWRD